MKNVYFLRITVLVVIALIFKVSNIYGQCPDGATITANDKCLFLTWNMPPNTLPSSTMTDGVVYNLISGTGAEDDPAIYRNTAPGSGACNANQSVLFTGDLTINGEVCTIVEGALGVEWLEFEAIVQSKKVMLKWKVYSDENNEYFEIEKSRDGIKWEVLDKIEDRHTNETKAYKYIDPNGLSGATYYRISQSDFSGQKSFSTVVVVFVTNNEQFNFYYFDQSINFTESISSEFDGLKGQISNISGSVLYEWDLMKNQTAYDIHELNLQTGMYVINVYSPTLNITKKIFVR